MCPQVLILITPGPWESAAAGNISARARVWCGRSSSPSCPHSDDKYPLFFAPLPSPCYLLLPCFHGWCHQGMFASLRVYCGGGDIQIILHISGYSSRWEIGNMEQLIHDTDYWLLYYHPEYAVDIVNIQCTMVAGGMRKTVSQWRDIYSILATVLKVGTSRVLNFDDKFRQFSGFTHFPMNFQ